MSYSVEPVAAPLPENDAEAWQRIESLREKHHGDAHAQSAALLRLRAALTARYPYRPGRADDDAALSDCPWADGPPLENAGRDIAQR